MTRIIWSFCFIATFLILSSCQKDDTAKEVLQKSILAIDTIETIHYKQDMMRTNPQNMADTISRFREMYFTRLITDSIVGVKGHWYMYIDDRTNVVYEDIYDGNRLIRKNNKDSVARVYDLSENPEFKKQHFWSHNTLFGMQFEFKHILENPNSYSIERFNDTLIQGKNCFQIFVSLEDKITMPGFATKLETNEGSVSETVFYIDKNTYYPLRVKGESYSLATPEEKVFIDQIYYNIEFNQPIDEEQFNTSDESLKGFEQKIIIQI